jgi:hypothetical protein
MRGDEAGGGTHRLLGGHLGGADALAWVRRRATHTALGWAALRTWRYLRSAMRGWLVDGHGIARRGDAALTGWRVGVRWAHSRLHARRWWIVGRARRGIVWSSRKGGRVGRGPGGNKYGGLLLLLEIGRSRLCARRNPSTSASCRWSAGAICKPNKGRSGTLATTSRHGRSWLGRMRRGHLDGSCTESAVAFSVGGPSLLLCGLDAGCSSGGGQLLCTRDRWCGLGRRIGGCDLRHVALRLFWRCAVLAVLCWA